MNNRSIKNRNRRVWVRESGMLACDFRYSALFLNRDSKLNFSIDRRCEKFHNRNNKEKNCIFQGFKEAASKCCRMGQNIYSGAHGDVLWQSAAARFPSLKVAGCRDLG